MRTLHRETSAARAAAAAPARPRARPRLRLDPDEAATFALILGVHAAWALLTAQADALGLWIAVPALAAVLTLHSSLTHEVVHGHPFGRRALDEALVRLPLGLAVPLGRFRDTHLAHHFDPHLTDPYDDPESYYLDPAVWRRLPRPARALLRANNTLLGRVTLGPAIGLAVFYAGDAAAILRGDRRVARSWAAHAVGLAAVGLWLATVSTMPVWACAAAAYAALGVLRIRTFLEHRAHEAVGGRTVIIEDRGPLAFLFLNNNLHAVHHAHPRLPWLRLPEVYARRRERFLARNRGYRYRSYAEVARRHLLRAKEPVPHPLRPGGEGAA